MAALLVLCACGSTEEAERIATALVEERLAACVQIVPVTSVYHWEGRIEHAAEHRLEIKTSAATWDALAARLRGLHSYDLPEITRLPLDGTADYLAWVEAETKPLASPRT